MSNIQINIDEYTPPHILRAVTTMLHQIAAHEQYASPQPTPWDGETTHVESEPVHPLMPEVHAQEGTPPLDTAGLPWDERIHAESHGINKDGTWRLRRNINVTAPGLVERIQAEQRAALAAPVVEVAPTPVEDEPQPPLDIGVGSVPAASFDTPTPVTVVVDSDVPPPPPVAVVPPPPVPLAVDDAVSAFTSVLRRITEDQAKGTISVEQVNAALASLGLAQMRDLMTRPDLVVPFETALYVA